MHLATRGYFRRLPVFLLIDTSSAMAGTFQVTLQEGLGVLRRELMAHSLASQCAYLAQIICGEPPQMIHLAPVERFEPLPVRAEGPCMLGPALSMLTDSLAFDLIEPRTERPGDYRPIAFLLLGSQPEANWETALRGLNEIRGQRQPLIVALANEREMARALLPLTEHCFTMRQPAEAVYVTNYFFWIAQTIAMVCESNADGKTSIGFPMLPYGALTI